MSTKIFTPKQALNKAFLKIKPNRSHIEAYKANLTKLLDHINEKESEEFHKNLVSDFLKNTYYSPTYFINTKGRNDLVIHNGKEAKTTVGVIIEAKKPSNKAEMINGNNINAKAFQELVLYYLRERITEKNLEVKYLIACNIYEWYIFDAQIFDKAFAQNKALVKQFTDFEEGRLASKNTDFFYESVAKPAINAVKDDLIYTHFNIREYEKPLRNSDKKDDNKLIALYKLLSPEHLLKLPFANDSNSLDKVFYSELLHIIGLTEIKEGSKKLIQRKKEGERNDGSLLENAIIQLDSLDKIDRLEKPLQYCNTKDERLFTVGLELAITWMNRVLFLKLLEAQLITYHKGNKDYSFLNREKVNSFDDLNTLFFQVLAKKSEERNSKVKAKFSNVPYLNSSLFEPTELEHACFFISQLEHIEIPVLSNTVLKDSTGKKRTGKLNTLEYLFEFLNSYDFASEGTEDIQEDNKTLINASVLGLIFEKINGYKDGSFFTPGFITMYMCRETLRRAVVQKFNEAKSWNCSDFSELYDKIEDRSEANNIINSLKLCDPAVGSGHFLVSALNEIIAIKSELKILQDREGKRLKEYQVEVVNDELIVTDEDSELFEYNPANKESQRIQETLFHEKQTIIENCLFGVDINPNSVKICRLRLWIELLKNAYYKKSGELETLPNIDINIKCGNSLISRFALDSDLKKALKKSKWNIDTYKIAVQSYREASSKVQKREMEGLIASIKSDFRTEISQNSKEQKQLDKLSEELYRKYVSEKLFEQKLTKEQIKDKEKLEADIKKYKEKIEEIKSNKIYENAFEWRFEFPEVLNDAGDFIGFDIVIGNPPYLSSKDFDKNLINYLSEIYTTSQYQLDLYVSFIEKGITILKKNGSIAFITPNSWLKNMLFSSCRKYLLENVSFVQLFPNLENIFDEASVDTLIFIARKSAISNGIEIYSFKSQIPYFKHIVEQNRFLENERLVFDVEANPALSLILKKIKEQSIPLSEIAEITRGVNPYDKYQGQSEEIISNKAYHASYKKDDTFLPEIRGKHVNSYSYQWDGKHYISYGDWLAAPREKKYFTGKRLIMRQVLGEKLNCTIIEEDFIIDQSVFIAKPKTDYLPFIFAIQGLLASTLISKFFKFTSNEFDALFPKIKIGEFRELPILKNLSEVENKISKIVLQILLDKKNEPKSDTGDYERKVDNLIYELYGLTEEEIKIVDGAEL